MDVICSVHVLYIEVYFCNLNFPVLIVKACKKFETKYFVACRSYVV